MNMRIPQILGNDAHASTAVPRPFFLRPGYESNSRPALSTIVSFPDPHVLPPERGSGISGGVGQGSRAIVFAE